MKILDFVQEICNNSQNLKRGQISCTYKHYLCLKDMIEKQREYAVIMEDDVNFKDNIPLVFKGTFLMFVSP